MSRPSLFLDWTDGNATKVVEPGSSKKLAGWVVESPPFQYMNWLFWLTDEWIQWLDEITQTLSSADGIESDSNIVVTTGNVTINSNKLASVAVVTNILEGMLVSGTGIAANTRVRSISGSDIFLTKVATATNASVSLTFAHHVATGANVQRQLDQLDAIIGATDPTVLITTGDTTINLYTISNLASTTGLLKGMAISGTGIAAGSVISAISGSTVTMSLAATASNATIFATFSHNYATGTDIKTQLNQLDAATKSMGGLGSIGRKSIAAAYQILLSDTGTVLNVDTTSGAVALTLPDPATFVGVVTIKDVGFLFDTNVCTLLRNGSESIEGLAATYTMRARGGAWTWESNGTNWFLIA